MNKCVWTCYAADYVLRHKVKLYSKHKKYCKRDVSDAKTASERLAAMLLSDETFAVGRLGLFELAAMRMYEFHKKNKYQVVMDNIYNCAGFFPNDIALGDEFTKCMCDAMGQMNIYACNRNIIENYFIDYYAPKNALISDNFNLFEVCRDECTWTKNLKGKKVLVVTPFVDSVKQQYAKRELLFQGTDILPEFQLVTYKSLMTVGDMKDDRFSTWFEALDYMRDEILKLEFDVALLGCGAYGFPLAAELKKAGKQAIHMGGVLQLLFGIMGKRWDGTRTGKEINIRKDVAKYYNEHWTYPIEEKPEGASKVEYGPYWK